MLDLLERFGPTRLPHVLHGPLGHLVSADPVRVARLVIRADVCAQVLHTLSGTRLRRLVRALPGTLLVELARSAPDPAGPGPRILRALPPGRRAALHEAVTEDRGEAASTVTVDTRLLDALPRNRVAAVARRAADRARARGDDAAVLDAVSYLPFDEGREQLLAATRGPAADDRATAWALLVGSAGRSGDPAPVATVLEDLLRLRNEQDPVRSAALTALAGVRPALFTDAVEPLLDRIAADAVEARDSSAATRRALGALAVGALREHAVTGQRDLLNWALRTLVRITGTSGSADFGRLDRTLRRGQEHTVLDALRPWLEAGAERSDYGLVLALARAVGRRADAMPGLQELLWQAVNYGEPTAARSAAALWLRAPAGRDERVESLLARHPSAIALPDVRQVVTRRRTDLLAACLDGTPPRGRFLGPGERWTVEVAGAERWTPRQQRAAQRAVERTVADEKLPLYLRTAALGQLARIPGQGADAVRAWAGDRDVVIAEAALAALAHTDRPAEALPELLAHAGDDRARVAVYAAGRAAAYTRPSRLAPLLAARTGPGTGKVTSRKEMVRLAAALLPRAEAAGLLVDAYGQPGQHLDVRAACVAAGTPLLADVRVWEATEDAAGGERALRVAVLRAHPTELDPALRPRYARLIQDVCRTDDDALAALAHTALVPWLPWAPHAAAVLVDAVTDLHRRGRWRSAADALVDAALTTPEAVGALNRALSLLATGETADDAGTERDRPARRRLGRAGPDPVAAGRSEQPARLGGARIRRPDPGRPPRPRAGRRRPALALPGPGGGPGHPAHGAGRARRPALRPPRARRQDRGDGRQAGRRSPGGGGGRPGHPAARRRTAGGYGRSGRGPARGRTDRGVRPGAPGGPGRGAPSCGCSASTPGTTCATWRTPRPPPRSDVTDPAGPGRPMDRVPRVGSGPRAGIRRGRAPPSGPCGRRASRRTSTPRCPARPCTDRAPPGPSHPPGRARRCP